MHHRLVLFPTTMSLLFIVAIVFFRPPSFAYAQNGTDPQYQNCSTTFSCGNITNIAYPFWGSNRPEYCGHPQFQLNCTGETAVIKIENLTYQVLAIDSGSQNIKVVRTDYVDGICPSNLANTTLNPTYFSYGLGIEDITLYYDCPAQTIPISLPGFTTQFSCGSSTDFYATSDLNNLTNAVLNYFATCETKVIVQANQSAVQTLEGSSKTEQNLIIALEQGFELHWDANDTICNTCKLSNGLCGTNNITDGSFACYCSDQPYSFSCDGSVPGQSSGVSSSKRHLSYLKSFGSVTSLMIILCGDLCI